MTLNNQSWALNQSSWQRKNDFVVELFKSEQDIAISERIFSLILNNESRTTKVNLRTREERTREILIAVDEKSSKIDKDWTIVQEVDQPFVELHFFQSQFNLFVSPIRVSLFSLTVSPGNQIENCGSVETFFGSRQKTSAVYQSAMKISWHPHHPIYPLRLWVSELESTSIERERSLVLCFGQGQIEMQ